MRASSGKCAEGTSNAESSRAPLPTEAMKLSNTEVLTHAHAVIKAKARAKRNQIDHIVFDEDARRFVFVFSPRRPVRVFILKSCSDYLSGFRKRNILKKEAKKTRAKESDHLQKLEARREHRKALNEQAIENAKQVEEAYGNGASCFLRSSVRHRGADLFDDAWHGTIGGDGDASKDEEFSGFSSKEKEKDREVQEAYEDAEQLATVTVIDDFDPATLWNHGSTSAASLDMDVTAKEAAPALRSNGRSDEPAPRHAAAVQRSTTHGEQASRSSKVRSSKTKPKKIAYESKAARKDSRQKQRTRKGEKASLAGGRQSRGRRTDGKAKSRK